MTTPSLHERELTVTLDRLIVDQEFNNAVSHVQKSASRPGFRPGKMPKNMVLNFYGSEIKQKLVEKLIEKTFATACEKKEVIAVSKPNFLPVSEIVVEQDFTYRAIFQIKPKLEIKKYDGLELSFKKFVFNEDDILDELKAVQESMATYVPTDRVEISGNDQVHCDSTVYIDDEHKPEFSHTDYAVPMFAENLPDYLRTALLGKKVGDHVQVSYELPTDSQDESLSGKTCKMDLKINSFKERVLPTIDDDFAKDVSTQFNSLDELKESIRLRFTITAKRRNDYYKQDAMMKALVENNPIDVPPALVEKMAMSLINRELETMDKKYAEELLKNYWQELWDSVQERAQFRVKGELILEALINDLGITATDEEIASKKHHSKEMSHEDATYAAQIQNLLIAIEAKAILSEVEQPLFPKN